MRDSNAQDPDKIETVGQTEEDAVGDDWGVMRDVVGVLERIQFPPPLRAAWDGDGATIEQIPPASPAPATNFDSFYLRHRPVLRQKMMRLCAGDPELAEDLTQQTLLVAYRVREQLSEVDDHEAWLYTVASRAAYKVFGRRRMEQERLRIIGADLSPPAQLHDLTLLDDLLCRTLTTRQQRIILYRFCDGQPRQWIADQMGLSVRTIDSEIKRSLDKLRPFLDPSQEDN